MKVWVYSSRSADIRVFSEDKFSEVRKEQDLDNRCTVEEAINMGLDVGGSEKEGYFYIDDGGHIKLTEVE